MQTSLPYLNLRFLEVNHQKKGCVLEKKRLNEKHLGNVRLSYKNTSTTGVNLEIVEENNYYTFGLKHKGYNNQIAGRDHKYGFGNKEEQNELGLDWIDITARNYDPALGRWMNIDPLAEQMRRHSPYNYAFDNPVFFSDPDGQKPWPISKLFNGAKRIIVSGWLRNSNSAKHGAVDIAHKGSTGQISGGTIEATHGGIVTVSQSDNATAGNWVVVTNGDLRTRYLHMLNTPSAKEGQKVNEGDVLGEVGSTGRSEAPHVHYEIQRKIKGVWERINPVEGGQDKVKPSDEVKLIDPQQIINDRDGTESKPQTEETSTGSNLRQSWKKFLNSVSEFRKTRDSLGETKKD